MIYRKLHNFPQEIIKELKDYFFNTSDEFKEYGSRNNSNSIFIEYRLKESHRKYVFKKIFKSNIRLTNEYAYIRSTRFDDPSQWFHRDTIRNTALNIPIQTDPNLGAFFIAHDKNQNEWDRSKVKKLTTDCPILFDTKVMHGYMNATDQDRIMFSISFEEEINKVTVPEEWL